MKTIEGNNRIIAEFMGEKELISESDFLAMEHKAHNPIIIEYLKYNSSWDWLLPVVEKIESFEDENRCAKYNFNCVQSFVEIVDNETSEEIVGIDLDNKFDSIYQAVVQFIEWYNKKK